MRSRDFEAMVREMVGELPPEYFEGIAGVAVTGKTVPHPVRADIYTLGECVPHAFGTGVVLAASVQWAACASRGC